MGVVQQGKRCETGLRMACRARQESGDQGAEATEAVQRTHRTAMTARAAPVRSQQTPGCVCLSCLEIVILPALLT